MVLRLAMQSLRNRWITAVLTMLAIAASVMLFLAVEKVRNGARSSFANTISGTDLIMGARSGGIQLLLYSVFRIGNATNNVTWKSFDDIASRPEVSWIIPISLGDSHRGFRVLGTTPEYFERYRYRRGHGLEFRDGAPFDDLFDTVIGADVAKALGYRIGDPITVAHGIGAFVATQHADKPFRVVGTLEKTGTPVDRTNHVSLEAIEAIHIDWVSGARIPGQTITANSVRQLQLRPKAITAAFIGLKSKLLTFKLQRFINNYRAEPLSAILPGVALQELWSLMGTAENGAGPKTIVGLLVSEAAILAHLGVLVGMAALYTVLFVLRPLIETAYGLHLDIEPPSGAELAALGTILLGGCLAGLLPAWRAYQFSLADGMMVRT